MEYPRHWLSLKYTSGDVFQRNQRTASSEGARGGVNVAPRFAEGQRGGVGGGEGAAALRQAVAFLLAVSGVPRAPPSATPEVRRPESGVALSPAAALPPPLSFQVTVTPVLSVEVQPGKRKPLQVSKTRETNKPISLVRGQ